MNFQISKLIVLLLVSSYSIAMHKSPASAPIKLKIHRHSAGNELKKIWQQITISPEAKFVALKEQVAKLLQRPTHDFVLAHVDLHNTMLYDQDSQKTLQELGIADKTSLWVLSVVAASKK